MIYNLNSSIENNNNNNKNKKTNWVGKKKEKHTVSWLHTCAHSVHYSTQSFLVGVCQHGTSWLSDILPTLPCKSSPNLSYCEGISCVQASSDPTTDVLLDLSMGSGWATPKLFFWRSRSFVDLDVWYSCHVES